MTVYEIIKKHIDKLDYMGFLKMGAPDDEYDMESLLILKWMNASPSEKRIAKAICNVFSSMFGQKFEETDFSVVARDIYLDLITEGIIK